MIDIETELAFPGAQTAHAALSAHAKSHDIPPEIDAPGHLAFSFQGNRLEFLTVPGRMRIRLSAVSPNTLYFLKEAVAHHLEEADPEAARTLRWPGDEGADSHRTPPNFRLLTVLERSRPVEGMTRLHLAGEDLEPLTRDGIHVKLMLPADRTRSPVWPGVAANGATRWPKGADRLHVRYFTLLGLDAEAGRVAIDFVDHPDGQISDWARAARSGDRIGIMGPGGGLPPATDRPLILMGDATALPALLRILEALPASAEGCVIAPLRPDDAGYLPASPLETLLLGPERFAASAAGRFAEALAARPEARVWVGAEHALVHEARRIAAGLPAERKEIGTYWRRGRRGDARRDDHDD
ncbi:siderophore-interacting protein [Rhodovulum sulfidophilum]|uniref:siderophore-interacting protein n=1 Tax=Rhodovulum sulfidophilum TaxID=35806 RepID=UPI001926C202|nr:siderophore-interacting protein [Rhodovulum sulfidophilum]MBL3585641.1 siderophore-interacting protein [Rhodovulum sulfidophilum]